MEKPSETESSRINIDCPNCKHPHIIRKEQFGDMSVKCKNCFISLFADPDADWPPKDPNLTEGYLQVIGKMKIKWYLAFIILACIDVVGSNLDIAGIPRSEFLISWTCWIWAFVIAVRLGWIRGIGGYILFYSFGLMVDIIIFGL